VSETVNQDGIYRQNRLCHSFSGDANQKGWVNVPSIGVIVVAPDMVEAIVTMTYIVNSSAGDSEKLLWILRKAKPKTIRKVKVKIALENGFTSVNMQYHISLEIPTQ